MKLTKQIEYCKKRNLPMFAPEDGKCWNCHRSMNDTDLMHITGCPHCYRSFCD